MTKEKNISIKNIYYMLSYAYKALRHKNYEKIQSESFENIYDLLAAILAIGIASQLKHGLKKEYIQEQDDLSTLKGRLLFNESIKLIIGNERKLICRFDDLSENNYMNRILKTTTLFLIKNGNVEDKNKDALKKNLWFFSKIDVLEPSAINWKILHYNRNNASYLMLMNICYLVMHELLLTTEKGSQKLASFFDEQQMSRLYEKFILEYYKKEFSQYNPLPKEIKWNTTSTIDYLPKMKSDVMLVNGNRKLIIDAKYYGKIMQTHFDADTFRSHNLYQIFTYVKNECKGHSELVDGMLLYAKTDGHNILNTSYCLDNSKISIRVLDLSKEFIEIKRQLNSIIEEWKSFSKNQNETTLV